MNIKLPPGHISVRTVRETVTSEGKRESFELFPPKVLTVMRAIKVLAGNELRLGSDVESVLADELVTTQDLGDALDRTVFQGNPEDMLPLAQLVQMWQNNPKNFFQLLEHT